jgi:perosamine synthetase
MTNGEEVRAFEAMFAHRVGAQYAIAMCNGTATLHTALAAMGVKRGDKVAVPPLTMASTTIAVLHAGAVPVFVDVDPDTWLMGPTEAKWKMGVSLYGLCYEPTTPKTRQRSYRHQWSVDDAAQTLRHVDAGFYAEDRTFTSYSFQQSKHLALGEGGMLVTDDGALARKAREFSSLGYIMAAEQPRIDPRSLKHPGNARHFSHGWNYRMSDLVAKEGQTKCLQWDALLDARRFCAALYSQAVAGCPWITPQHVPDGWTHDYWCYGVALEDKELWTPFTDAIVRNGGEMPYGAWRLTYHEPAFQHLAGAGDLQSFRGPSTCPVAEDLQPRLVQGQTNDTEAAVRNADAWAAAIKEVGG